ncbi:NAD(P)H-dependent oxidoreductase [Demequina oxidasica]|uniref:NAD(P)H-dependent oxidoreductase n=1 Tax=Demequina oxidasica TaxID=676199 RepID=UPI000783F20E|nr:NAD(P)H-dependent oxidoreductase [Demequina oxidasica]
MTSILVVIGTPVTDSLNHAMAQAYVESAREAGADVDVIDLATDPIPPHPHQRGNLRMPRDGNDLALDPGVGDYIARVESADHLVVLFPQWWGSYPAALKAWVDAVFLSGFAFRYAPTGRGWDKLLKGRTARIVMTMDSPRLWNRLAYRDAAIATLKNATLWYSGIKTIGVTRVGEVRHQDTAALTKAVAKIGNLGAADAKRTPTLRHAGIQVAT